MTLQAADNLLLIVVGSDLRAEEADRPLAYRLRQQIDDWLSEHADALNIDIEPVVCTDLWYMNHADLQPRPTICLGDPSINALSDFFSHAVAGDDDEDDDDDDLGDADEVMARACDGPRVVLQLDPEFTDLRVCIWGMDHELTAQGLEVFCRDYLADYLTAVATQVEPNID